MDENPRGGPHRLLRAPARLRALRDAVVVHRPPQGRDEPGPSPRHRRREGARHGHLARRGLIGIDAYLSYRLLRRERRRPPPRSAGGGEVAGHSP